MRRTDSARLLLVCLSGLLVACQSEGAEPVDDFASEALYGASSFRKADFIANIDSTQTVPRSTDRGNTASAAFWLRGSRHAPRLYYRIVLDEGLDLDGYVTRTVANDDITKIHLHGAPVGVKGPHRLNIYKAPCQDDRDLVTKPFTGEFRGRWDNGDATDFDNCPALESNVPGQSVALSDALEELCTGNLYVNVHTAFNDADGELRGQVEPTYRSRRPCQALGH